MADARREHEYDVALATIAYLGSAMAGKLKPTEANPFRERPPETAERRAEEAKEGWGVLREFLKAANGGRS